MIICISLILLLSVISMNAMDKKIDEQGFVRDEVAQSAKELRIWASEEIKEKIKSLEAGRLGLEEKQARFRFNLQSNNSSHSKWDLSACLSIILANQMRMQREIYGLLAGREGIIPDEFRPELQSILRRLDDDLSRGNNIG